MAGGAIKVEGMAEAKALLDGLASEVQEAILRKALRAAAAPIVNAASWNAPVKTGKLAQAIQASPARVVDKTTIGVAMQPKGGWFKGKTYYGGYQEWGFTVGVKHNKPPKLPGRRRRPRTAKQMQEAYAGSRFMPGRHFMTKAVDEKVEDASRLFYEQVREVAEKRAARFARRMARGNR